MDDDFLPLRERVTPAQFLELLRDHHRQTCQGMGGDPFATLSFSTTVSEWQFASWLKESKELLGAFNESFQMACPLAEWEAALIPEDQRTLADVCALLARHCQLPRPQAVVIAGVPCMKGGIFLAIRSLLKAAGADVDALGPSTSLAPYTLLYPHVFLGPISWLSPGALPNLKFHNPGADVAVWMFCSGPVIGLIGWILSLCGLTEHKEYFGIACLLLLAGSVCLLLCSPVTRIEFGELRTFRDLATAIANHVSVSGNAAPAPHV